MGNAHAANALCLHHACRIKSAFHLTPEADTVTLRTPPWIKIYNWARCYQQTKAIDVEHILCIAKCNCILRKMVQDERKVNQKQVTVELELWSSRSFQTSVVSWCMVVHKKSFFSVQPVHRILHYDEKKRALTMTLTSDNEWRKGVGHVWHHLCFSAKRIIIPHRNV